MMHCAANACASPPPPTPDRRRGAPSRRCGGGEGPSPRAAEARGSPPAVAGTRIGASIATSWSPAAPLVPPVAIDDRSSIWADRGGEVSPTLPYRSYAGAGRARAASRPCTFSWRGSCSTHRSKRVHSRRSRAATGITRRGAAVARTSRYDSRATTAAERGMAALHTQVAGGEECPAPAVLSRTYRGASKRAPF
eukprot:scaffold2256_cov371-Prasinococcus_capsulatus_cf.AAC.7